MTTGTLPDNVNQLLNAFVASARRRFADDLRSIVLFGSGAEGALRPTSDLNVVVVLKTFERARVDELREDVRMAISAANLNPMFILESELAAAAEYFAVKFFDITKRRSVLFGEDVFERIDVPREAVIRRLRQSLLNQTLRLRHTYAARSLRDEQASLAVADAAGPLRAAAAAILDLEGKGAASPKEALRQIVNEHEPSLLPLLELLSVARENQILPVGTAASALFDLVRLAETLYKVASGVR
jgi:predicted nucleotidyltransferase